MNNIEKYSEKTFDSIKHIDEYGNEFWYARELQIILEYAEWRNFKTAIAKAKEACKNSGIAIDSCFVEFNKTSKMPRGGEKKLLDYKLSRYACYLIVQNGDPTKPSIAQGQTYFAIQTRKQELSEQDFEQLSEDERRLHLRSSVKDFNKKLADSAHDVGVQNYGKFQNSGYKGLYHGETASDIKERKGISRSQDILDHMGATELAANYFRITQTEEKLKTGTVEGESQACKVHYKIGKKVRETMIEISGIAP